MEAAAVQAGHQRVGVSRAPVRSASEAASTGGNPSLKRQGRSLVISLAVERLDGRALSHLGKTDETDVPEGFKPHLIGQAGDMVKQNKKAGPKRFRTVVRDAVTGRFLPRTAAKRRPKTTVTDRIRLGRRGTKQRRK